MIKLGICCATNMLSLAIVRDQSILAELLLARDKIDDLILLLDQVLLSAHLVPRDIEEVVVVKGPGSYAGLRTSLTVGKTFALVQAIPIKTVQTLELMAWQVRWFPGLIAVVMESRRDEVNLGLFGGGAILNPLVSCLSIKKTLLFSKLSRVQRDILVVGDLRVVPAEIQKWYHGIIPKASEAIALSEMLSAWPEEDVVPLYAYPVNTTQGKSK